MPENATVPPKALEEAQEAKQRGISKEVQVVIWSAGSTIIAALIAAAAAIYTGVASVPIIDGSTGVGVLEQQNSALQERVSDLEDTGAELNDTAADLQADNDHLRAENKDLKAQLAVVSEPGTPPDGDGDPVTVIKPSSDLTLAEIDDPFRIQAGDLEAGTVASLRDAEWNDEAATADAYDIAVVGDSLSTRTQTAWSSAAGAPKTKTECTTAIAASEPYLFTSLSVFAVDDVICMRTSEGAIALLTITAVNPDAHTTAFKYTLFD